jgi:hypothetical protein
MSIGTTEERFDIGRVIGRTFGLIGRNFVMFALMSIVLVGLPEFGVSALSAYAYSASYQTGATNLSGIGIIGVIVTLVLSYALIGVITRASIDDLSGKGARLGPAAADGVRYFFPLFLVAVLTGIGVFLGLLLLVIPGIYLAVRWVVAAPALVAEAVGPTAALGRSSELISGHWWASFGLVLLYLVAVVVVAFATEFFAGIGGIASDTITSLDAASLAYAATSALGSSLVSMLSAAGTAALYFELRRVKEGVGVEEIAAVFE